MSGKSAAARPMGGLLSTKKALGSGTGGEDVTCDELRVFTEEGTEETEKRDSERGLDEEKTSLVNITDSANDKNSSSPKVVSRDSLSLNHHSLPSGTGQQQQLSNFQHGGHNNDNNIFGAVTPGAAVNPHHPFNFVSRYRNENGKFLDPTSLYNNSAAAAADAFRYFMPPYPPNGYPPMGFRPTNSLAQFMLYNQEHFGGPNPAAPMGIPTMSIDPKSGIPRISPYPFPSPHQYSPHHHQQGIYPPTDFRQGNWYQHPISSAIHPHLPPPYSPGAHPFSPSFVKYSSQILSPLTPSSPYGNAISPAFMAPKSDYPYQHLDLKHNGGSSSSAITSKSSLPASAGTAGDNESSAGGISSYPSIAGSTYASFLNGYHHHPFPTPTAGTTNNYPPILFSVTDPSKKNNSHVTVMTGSTAAEVSPPPPGTEDNYAFPGNKQQQQQQRLSINHNNNNHHHLYHPAVNPNPAAPVKKKKAHKNAGGGGTGDCSSIGCSNAPNVPHIKKPLNAFMLFMKDQRSKVMEECTLKESSAINQLLGRKWHSLTREEQAKYYEMARKERQIHMQKYPGWSARDNYHAHNNQTCPGNGEGVPLVPGGIKKRKKKREKPADPSEVNTELSASKKCRARYGIDQQNDWCKPCRRKKKCIKFIEESDIINNNNNFNFTTPSTLTTKHTNHNDDDDDAIDDHNNNDDVPLPSSSHHFLTTATSANQSSSSLSAVHITNTGNVGSNNTEEGRGVINPKGEYNNNNQEVNFEGTEDNNSVITSISDSDVSNSDEEEESEEIIDKKEILAATLQCTPRQPIISESPARNKNRKIEEGIKKVSETKPKKVKKEYKKMPKMLAKHHNKQSSRSSPHSTPTTNYTTNNSHQNLYAAATAELMAAASSSPFSPLYQPYFLAMIGAAAAVNSPLMTPLAAPSPYNSHLAPKLENNSNHMTGGGGAFTKVVGVEPGAAANPTKRKRKRNRNHDRDNIEEPATSSPKKFDGREEEEELEENGDDEELGGKWGGDGRDNDGGSPLSPLSVSPVNSPEESFPSPSHQPADHRSSVPTKSSCVTLNKLPTDAAETRQAQSSHEALEGISSVRSSTCKKRKHENVAVVGKVGKQQHTQHEGCYDNTSNCYPPHYQQYHNNSGFVHQPPLKFYPAGPQLPPAAAVPMNPFWPPPPPVPRHDYYTNYFWNGGLAPKSSSVNNKGEEFCCCGSSCCKKCPATENREEAEEEEESSSSSSLSSVITSTKSADEGNANVTNNPNDNDQQPDAIKSSSSSSKKKCSSRHHRHGDNNNHGGHHSFPPYHPPSPYNTSGGHHLNPTSLSPFAAAAAAAAFANPDLYFLNYWRAVSTALSPLTAAPFLGVGGGSTVLPPPQQRHHHASSSRHQHLNEHDLPHKYPNPSNNNNTVTSVNPPKHNRAATAFKKATGDEERQIHGIYDFDSTVSSPTKTNTKGFHCYEMAATPLPQTNPKSVGGLGNVKKLTNTSNKNYNPNVLLVSKNSCTSHHRHTNKKSSMAAGSSYYNHHVNYQERSGGGTVSSHGITKQMALPKFRLVAAKGGTKSDVCSTNSCHAATTEKEKKHVSGMASSSSINNNKYYNNSKKRGEGRVQITAAMPSDSGLVNSPVQQPPPDSTSSDTAASGNHLTSRSFLAHKEATAVDLPPKIAEATTNDIVVVAPMSMNTTKDSKKIYATERQCSGGGVDEDALRTYTFEGAPPGSGEEAETENELKEMMMDEMLGETNNINHEHLNNSASTREVVCSQTLTLLKRTKISTISSNDHNLTTIINKKTSEGNALPISNLLNTLVNTSFGAVDTNKWEENDDYDNTLNHINENLNHHLGTVTNSSNTVAHKQLKLASHSVTAASNSGIGTVPTVVNCDRFILPSNLMYRDTTPNNNPTTTLIDKNDVEQTIIISDDDNPLKSQSLYDSIKYAAHLNNIHSSPIKQK